MIISLQQSLYCIICLQWQLVSGDARAWSLIWRPFFHYRYNVSMSGHSYANEILYSFVIVNLDLNLSVILPTFLKLSYRFGFWEHRVLNLVQRLLMGKCYCPGASLTFYGLRGSNANHLLFVSVSEKSNCIWNFTFCLMLCSSCAWRIWSWIISILMTLQLE